MCQDALHHRRAGGDPAKVGMKLVPGQGNGMQRREPATGKANLSDRLRFVAIESHGCIVVCEELPC